MPAAREAVAPFGVGAGGEEPPSSGPTGTRLTLLRGFELVSDGVRVALPMSAQRVAAFLALHDRPVLRSYVAGSLWLDTTEGRAHANLRSALWRLHRCSRDLVVAQGQQLCLGSNVDVDLREVEALARRTIREGEAVLLEPTATRLIDDLLPDWYDDWVLIEREQFRQLRLRALDVLCERLTDAGRLGDALQVGLYALAGEPLRESAHRAVIRVHLADGNAGEAIRQYRLCRRLLAELGVRPSRQIEELLRGVTTADTPA